MKNNLTIKEIAFPYVLAGDDERRYELLCEFQTKDGAFQRVYVQDAGEDVIIEISKDRAIVGMFSVEEGKVSALFDYIEASVNGKDGFVSWLSGEFEQLLEKASSEGRKYPLIQVGIGAADKVPLFYRQKMLDSVTYKALEAHTVSVDYVQESLEDLDEEMLFTLPDEAFDVTPKVTQAGLLPDGWKWVDYDDGSGHLESPDGKKYFDYDRQPYSQSGNIEYRETETDSFGPFFDFDEAGSFDDFKHSAEKTILGHVLENFGGLARSKAAQVISKSEEVRGTESLCDDLDSGYAPQALRSLDEDWLAEPKVTKAGSLPEGWNWVDYPDLSGHLESPDGKKWFQYDVHREAYVEFKRDNDSRWSSYPGRFDDFKHAAEKAISENLLEKVGSFDMDKMRFYVIEDKRNNFSIEYFDGGAAAWERFMEAKSDVKKFPALGVYIGDGSLDLLHGVNGDAVLVPDYRYTDNFSEAMKAADADIQAAVEWLVLEGGNVLLEYQNDMLPGWIEGDVTVLVPVTLGEKPPSSYCDDKVLKATVSSGIDAIDSLYLEMHGWVAYDELLRHPEEYVSDGTIKVQYLNVNYVFEKNVVGIDGQMDIAPCEFKEMVKRLQKPYQLTVYDGAKYTGSFRDKHEFIVATFDTLPEAVKGWYELQERRRVPALVQQLGDKSVLFNGYDDNSKKIPLEDAAKKYGFDARGLSDVLADAESRASKAELKGKENDLEK